MPAVHTYIIIASCLGNLHNYTRHEKSSGSDSLHIITFFFRHEQQRSLDLCGTLPSLQLVHTRLMLALGAVPLQIALAGKGGRCIPPTDRWEWLCLCWPLRKRDPVIPNRMNMSQLPLKQITMSPSNVSLTSVACSVWGNYFEVFLSRLKPFPRSILGETAGKRTNWLACLCNLKLQVSFWKLRATWCNIFRIDELSWQVMFLWFLALYVSTNKSTWFVFISFLIKFWILLQK